MRTRPLAVLLVGGLVVASLAACNVVNNVLVDGVTAAGPVSEVRIVDGGSGNVSVTVESTAKQIEVKRTVHYGRTAPAQTAKVDGSVLNLGMECGFDCSISYQVTLPTAAKVSGTNSSGDVELSGVAAVDVRVSSGNVSVRNVSGPVSVSASSGDINVTGVGGPVNLRATSGNVRALQISGPTVRMETSSGDIEVATTTVADLSLTATSGNIQARVPAGPYHLTTDVGSGDVRVQIPTDPTAAHTINARTSSGDITITAI